MSRIWDLIIFLFTSKWGIFLIFVCLIVIGMVISAIEKRKGEDEKKSSDLDEIVSSYSGMNHMPWKDTEDENQDKKKGKVEAFYSGKNPKLANLRTIVFKEEKMMKERAADVAEREAKEKDLLR